MRNSLDLDGCLAVVTGGASVRIAEGDPSLDLRMDRIDRAINLLRTNGRALRTDSTVRFGSLVDYFTNITPTAAFGGKAVIHQ
jgi:hypothetical protein